MNAKTIFVFVYIASFFCTAFSLSSAVEAQPPTVAARQHDTVLPQPNAHEYFVKAGEALVDREKIGTELTQQEKQELVKRKAEALRILREGFAYEYQLPSSAILKTPRYSSNHRALARLLVAEGQAYREQKNWKAAANSFLDAIRLGIETPRGAPLMGAVVGTAVESIGRRYLWEIIDQLDAAAARHAARRLETIEARRHPFVETLRVDWQVNESGVRQQALDIHNPLWPADKAVSEYARLMAVEIDEAQRPYIASKQRAIFETTENLLEESLQASADNAANALELLFRLSKSIIDNARFSDTKSRTHNDLITVSLALRAYQLEHGKYPASLTEIVPEYLEQIPDDSFALKKPLRYRLEGEKYVLYSIGPDGRDDDGAPISEPGVTLLIVQNYSKGDMVAGVDVR